MPFYRSPDDEFLFMDDLSVGVGRLSIDGKMKRFVAMISEEHIIGFDHVEMCALLAELTRAHRELTQLLQEDLKGLPPQDGGDDLQSTQFAKSDERLN